MRYQVLVNGNKFFITEEEAKNIAKGDSKGIVFVPSVKGYLNLSYVAYILPEDKIDRSQMTSGRLHDGTKVIKKFGQWVDAQNPELRFDLVYYPELAKEDGVLTEEEFENRQKLLQ